MAPHTPPRPPRRPRTVERADGPYEDPYAWLRDRDHPDVRAHLEAENAYVDAQLGHLDGLRERLFDEIRSRIVETDVSVPIVDGPWAYYRRTREGLDYPIHCRRPAATAHEPLDPGRPAGDEEVLLDQNALAAADGYLSIGGLAVAPDHGSFAYLIDTDGNEEYALRIRDLATGEDVEEVIARAAYGLAWCRDGTALYYAVPDEAWRTHEIWRHRVGGPGGPEHDELILSEPDERFSLGVGTTRSRELVVIAAASKQTSECHLLDAHDPDARPRVVVPRRPGVEYHVEHDAARDRLLVLTNAPSEDGAAAVDFQLLQAPLADPAGWRPYVPHRPGVRLSDVDAFAGHVILTERAEAVVRLRIVDPTDPSADLDDPTAVLDVGDPAAITGLGPNPDDGAHEVRIVTTGLTRPPTVIDVDLLSGGRTVRKQQEVPGYDPEDYVSERHWATAPDGTAVPVSLVRHRTARTDGTGACLLYGYGSYEISIDPMFSSWRQVLLDRGVAFAIAHVRGGGEMGRAWYEQGRLEHKPTTFTDFVACADHLVDAGICSRDRLAIMGGSAGGLLVGAALNLRPDLCRAAVADVPFVDVFSTMSDPTLPLTVPEYEEWGDPNIPEVAATIRGYSPVDNVREAAYPALLVTAGLNDPRVGYWEPAKWVAHLRDVGTGDRPVLLKTELGAGHGGPSGRYDAWRERALSAAFVLDQLGAAAALPPLPEDWSTALAVAAHPDDLEYGAAAAVARWTDPETPGGSRQVAYLLLTRGEAGIATMPPEEAGPLREREQRAAGAEVGVDDVTFADHRDGVLVAGPPLRKDIARSIRRVRPDVVVAQASRPWGGVPDQADHRAFVSVLVDAVRDAGNRWVHRELAEDEGLEPWDGVRWIAFVGAAEPTHGIDVTDHLDRGMASLRAHATYFAVLGGTPEAMLRDFAGQAGQRQGVPHALLVERVGV